MVRKPTEGTTMIAISNVIAINRLMPWVLRGWIDISLHFRIHLFIGQSRIRAGVDHRSSR
jgi:hypothetical protein